jgi:hypothetical protein
LELSHEENQWIDEQNALLIRIESDPAAFDDESVKNAFDFFFKTMCNWRDKYNTGNLKNFWAIGIDYDGYSPGNNKKFIGLYRELMNMVSDKRLDRPATYITEVDGKTVELEEYDDGTTIIIER